LANPPVIDFICVDNLCGKIFGTESGDYSFLGTFENCNSSFGVHLARHPSGKQGSKVPWTASTDCGIRPVNWILASWQD